MVYAFVDNSRCGECADVEASEEGDAMFPRYQHTDGMEECYQIIHMTYSTFSFSPNSPSEQPQQPHSPNHQKPTTKRRMPSQPPIASPGIHDNQENAPDTMATSEGANKSKDNKIEDEHESATSTKKPENEEGVIRL